VWRHSIGGNVSKGINLLYFDGKCLGHDFEDAPLIKSFDSYYKKLKENHTILHNTPVEDLLAFFNEVSKKIIERDGPFQKKFSDDGINFLVYWFRQNFLEKAIAESLRMDPSVLDQYIETSDKKFLVSATPKGLITHWLSGNVPILGLLSLIQGLVTKNINILKVSKDTGMLIPHFLEEISKINVLVSDNKTIKGSDICKSIAVVYFDRNNIQAQEYFSNISNIRVAWGGMDAVESVMNTKRSYGTEDVIFGPKKSFAVIEKKEIDTQEKINILCQKLANDIFQIDQRGCNSPHNVFIEKNSKFESKHFAESLGIAMENLSKRNPQQYYSSLETLNVLKKRTEFDMFFDAFYPDSLEWSVLHANNNILEDSCFNRTIFVKTFSKKEEILNQCSHLTQSIGVAMDKDSLLEFARKAAIKGVDRFPKIGSMTLYEVPWDGMFVMDRFIKWTKLNN
jgi:hypothetical protein